MSTAAVQMYAVLLCSFVFISQNTCVVIKTASDTNRPQCCDCPGSPPPSSHQPLKPAAASEAQVEALVMQSSADTPSSALLGGCCFLAEFKVVS